MFWVWLALTVTNYRINPVDKFIESFFLVLYKMEINKMKQLVLIVVFYKHWAFNMIKPQTITALGRRYYGRLSLRKVISRDTKLITKVVFKGDNIS